MGIKSEDTYKFTGDNFFDIHEFIKLISGPREPQASHEGCRFEIPDCFHY